MRFEQPAPVSPEEARAIIERKWQARAARGEPFPEHPAAALPPGSKMPQVIERPQQAAPTGAAPQGNKQ